MGMKSSIGNVYNFLKRSDGKIFPQPKNREELILALTKEKGFLTKNVV